MSIDELRDVAAAVAGRSTHETGGVGGRIVVVAGGIARRYPEIVELSRDDLPAALVEPTAAPAGAKSAAGVGVAQFGEAARGR